MSLPVPTVCCFKKCACVRENERERESLSSDARYKCVRRESKRESKRERERERKMVNVCEREFV